MKPDHRVSKMLFDNLIFEDRRSQVVYDLEIKPHLKLHGKDKIRQHARIYRKGNKCGSCGSILSNGEWEWDHIKGGLDGRCDCLHNAQILCIACHAKKHGRYPQFGPGRAKAIEEFTKILDEPPAPPK